MRRETIRDLAMVGLAGGLLAFEVIGLKGALPLAAEALAREGVAAEVTTASRTAAMATASALREAGTLALRTAVDAAKLTARRIGTVKPAGPDGAAVLFAGGGAGHPGHARVQVVAVKAGVCRGIMKSSCSTVGVHTIRREGGTARPGSSL